ncbi:hypothetical protein JX266_012047 [Neoarthrinium moseri]|nr:hypothetical protein JX266_012047 [Neoarthrinium moseri]
MVNLSDLSMELFRATIEATVKELGLRRSMRLRKVSRLFNDEVLRAFETLFVFHSNIRFRFRLDYRALNTYQFGAALIPFTARFLSRRPHTNPAGFWKVFSADPVAEHYPPSRVTEPWELNISTFLNQLLDHLRVPENGRYDALVILCEYLDSSLAVLDGISSCNFSSPGIISGVLRGFRPLINKDLEASIIPVAILLKREDIYEPLLESAARKDPRYWGHMFETPVHAAVMSLQHNLTTRLLRMFSANLENPKHNHLIIPIERAIETGDLEMVNIVLGKGNHTHRRGAPEYSADPFQLRRGLMKSARLGHVAVTNRLLEYLQVTPLRRFGSLLASAMDCATIHGHVSTMELLAQYGARITKPYGGRGADPTPLDLACWTGNEDTVRWALSNAGELSAKMVKDAIFAAVLGNQVLALHLIMTAEPDLTMFEWSDWFDIVYQGIQARRYAALRYLLDEAKVLDGSPRFRGETVETGALLKLCAMDGHVEIFRALLRAGFSPNAPSLESDEPTGFWTPMMWAHTSSEPGSRQIEDILERLGIERADMTVDPWKYWLEVGYYPQPATRMYSKMPAWKRVSTCKPSVRTDESILVNVSSSK